MKRTFAFALTILTMTLLAIAPARAEMRIVTTTTDLGDFARTIGGDRIRVDVICQGHQDPHYVQARPSYMVTLSRADLLIAVGLELEVGWLPLLIQGARNPDINPERSGYLEAASVIAPIDIPTGTVDRSRGDIHPYGNPHYWLDPENAKLVAGAIAERMAELDPDNADFFRRNLQTFNEQIDRAMERWSEAMAPYHGTQIASYHQTFNYFLNRFGLVGVGYLEERPGIPPAPAHLARLISRMRDGGVHVIFHENYFSEATSEMVANRTGAHVLVLPTSVNGTDGTGSYIELIDYLIEQFVTAMED